MKINHRITRAEKIERRVRAKVRGTAERPRLNVYRSNQNLSLQVINDQAGKTIASASTMSDKKAKGTKTELAKQVAQDLAKKLKAAKITKLVFDRGHYKYHGRVRAVAEVMREEGFQV